MSYSPGARRYRYLHYGVIDPFPFAGPTIDDLIDRTRMLRAKQGNIKLMEVFDISHTEEYMIAQVTEYETLERDIKLEEYRFEAKMVRKWAEQKGMSKEERKTVWSELHKEWDETEKGWKEETVLMAAEKRVKEWKARKLEPIWVSKETKEKAEEGGNVACGQKKKKRKRGGRKKASRHVERTVEA